ncbi:DedA family protein [Arthrobacter sp. CAU 1506]|uniref:DedA family protein n=1 Tax=Arthrobacter sp. CAU 1506 TaxID=2560052 RepID=UPI0010AD25E4|nr:DedA family protein [Arthrobacter sp. CAU 1506]TJY72442.1 DedA family protein [Arthrobacter sp. CAU 1506]
MQTFMDALSVFIIDAAAQWWIYPLLLALCLIDGIFPPVPSESVVVALAAIAISAGAPNIWLIVAVAAAGAIAGDNIAYLIGRSIGADRFRWMQRPRVAAAFAWARRELDRRGALLILGARYIPVGRVAVNMTAGATGYHHRKFVLFSVAAGISWALYSVGIGALAGQWFHDHTLLAAGLAIVLALSLGLVLDHAMKLVGRRHAARLRAAAQAAHSPAGPAGAGQQAADDDGASSAAGAPAQAWRHPGDQPPESGSRTVRFEPYVHASVPSRNRSTAALDD